MKIITGLSEQPKQQSTLVLADGTRAVWSISYVSQQTGWFYDLSWNGTVIATGQRMVSSPNILRQYINKISFGIAVVSPNQLEPTTQTALVDGTVTCYLLEGADLQAIETTIFNAPAGQVQPVGSTTAGLPVVVLPANWGPAGGDLAYAYPNPQVIAMHDGTGQRLAFGTVADNQFLKRVGATVVGATVAPGTGDVTGPASSTIGNVALWADAAGTEIADGGTLGTAAFANSSSFLGATAAASGDLSGNYPGPNVAAIHTTSDGGTQLTIGAIADGEYLVRSGGTLIGSVPSGAGDVFGPSSTVTVGTVALFATTDGKTLGPSSITLGTIASQAASNVTITGGSIAGAVITSGVGGSISGVPINGSTIGAVTASSGRFTSVVSTGNISASGTITATGAIGASNFSGTSSGTNTGDQTISIIGDVTASGSTGVLTSTVTRINGQALATLATGILKNTTSTGVPSIAIATDFPTLNQNTTGNAATATALANARTIGGISFNGTDNVTSFPVPGPIGVTTPAAGNFTSIGVTTQGTGAFTTLSASGTTTIGTNAAAGRLIINGPSTASTGATLTGQFAGTDKFIIGTQNAIYGGTSANLIIRSISDNVLIGAAGTEMATFSSTGLAVTGALSSTTGANFATSSGAVNIGTATSVTDTRLTVQATGDYSPAISVRGNASAGNWARMDLVNPNTAGPMIFAQVASGETIFRNEGTNSSIYLQTAGGVTRATVSTTGLAVTGALSATGIVTAGDYFNATAADNGYRLSGTTIIGGSGTNLFIKGATSVNFQVPNGTTVGTFSSTGLAVTGDVYPSTLTFNRGGGAAWDSNGIRFQIDGTTYGKLALNDVGVLRTDCSIMSTGLSVTGNVSASGLLTGTLTNSTGLPLSTGVTGFLPIANGGTGLTSLGTAGQVLRVNAGATALEYATISSGSGTVTSVSVVNANGFDGTVATPTVAAAITLKTTVNGILKGNSTSGVVSAATSGTDYAPATSGSSILYGNSAGGFSNVTVGTGLTFTSGTLTATGGSSSGVFNIVSYGASPSASTATNTTAIQNAINAACSATNGGAVYVPAGSYNTNKLTVSSAGKAIVIFGDGDCSILRAQDSTGLLVFTDTSNYATFGVHDLFLQCDVSCLALKFNCQPTAAIHVRNLVQINRITVTAGNTNWTGAIEASNASNMLISNSLFEGGSQSVVLGNTAVKFTSICVNTLISNCNFNFWTYGIYCDVYQEGVFISNSYFIANLISAYFSRSSDALRIASLQFTNCNFDARAGSFSSTTSMNLPSVGGSVTMTIPTNLTSIVTAAGQYMRAIADGSNYFEFQISGYTPSTGVITGTATNVTGTPGSGPYASWGIQTMNNVYSIQTNNVQGLLCNNCYFIGGSDTSGNLRLTQTQFSAITGSKFFNSGAYGISLENSDPAVYVPTSPTDPTLQQSACNAVAITGNSFYGSAYSVKVASKNMNIVFQNNVRSLAYGGNTVPYQSAYMAPVNLNSSDASPGVSFGNYIQP